MSPTTERAVVKVARFDPARVFPPDARGASILLVIADEQMRQTSGAEQALHGGRMWYCHS